MLQTVGSQRQHSAYVNKDQPIEYGISATSCAVANTVGLYIPLDASLMKVMRLIMNAGSIWLTTMAGRTVTQKNLQQIVDKISSRLEESKRTRRP